MSQPEKVSATKTDQYRSYTVSEHERKMYERVYKFVCTGCNSVVERRSDAKRLRGSPEKLLRQEATQCVVRAMAMNVMAKQVYVVEGNSS
jgi:hypothetical protein